MAGWQGLGKRIEVGKSIKNEKVISHYNQGHEVTHKLHLRQAKRTAIPNWGIKIETNMGDPVNDQDIITTPNMVNQGESRIIAQAPAPRLHNLCRL